MLFLFGKRQTLYSFPPKSVGKRHTSVIRWVIAIREFLFNYGQEKKQIFHRIKNPAK